MAETEAAFMHRVRKKAEKSSYFQEAIKLRNTAVSDST
jgi:hypothetical protein